MLIFRHTLCSDICIYYEVITTIKLVTIQQHKIDYLHPFYPTLNPLTPLVTTNIFPTPMSLGVESWVKWVEAGSVFYQL